MQYSVPNLWVTTQSGWRISVDGSHAHLYYEILKFYYKTINILKSKKYYFYLNIHFLDKNAPKRLIGFLQNFF